MTHSLKNSLSPHALWMLAILLLVSASGCTKNSADTPASNGTNTSPTGRASLHFEAPVFEFGTAFQQQELHHRFHFVNDGERALTLTEVKPTCGCTIPLFSRAPIAPGEAGTIDLSFQAGALSGRISKKLTVRTDAPELDDIELFVRGTVEIPFLVSPHQTDLGKMFTGTTPGTRTVRVSWITDLDLEITEIGRTSESLEILSRTPFEEDGRKGEEITFDVKDWESTVDTAAHGSKYHQFLVFKTKHPDYPRTMHAVLGRFSLPISATPRIVNFGVIRDGAPTKKLVRLATQPGLEWTLEGLEGPDYLQVESRGTQTSASGDTTTVELTLLPDGISGSIKEHVKIRTSAPEQPEISIYIVANVRTND